MMITNSNLAQELLKFGYTFKGKDNCHKCMEEVLLYNHPSGPEKRPTAINPEDHPSRPGMLHSLGCGVKQE